MSVLHEFHPGTDLSFKASSPKDLSRFSFTSSRYVNRSVLLPERALLGSTQIPNTPVTSSPPKYYKTRHRNDGLTRMNGDASLNRFDMVGGPASVDDRLPVVQLQPFTRKEWRPSNSIPLSSSASNNSSSSSTVVTSSSIRLSRTKTCCEIARGEEKNVKKRSSRGESMELGLPRHKTTLSQKSSAGKANDNRQTLKNDSTVIAIRRDYTFLPSKPSTSHPTTDLIHRVLPSRSPKTDKPGPHAIRRGTTTITSSPVRDEKRMTLMGSGLCLTSRSSTFTNDSDRWNINTQRDSGKTRSPMDNAMIRSSSLERNQSHPEIIYHRSRTTQDTMSLHPVGLRSMQRVKTDTSAYHQMGPSSVFPIGVTGNRDILDKQGSRPIGFESQLASLLRVTLDEMRKIQPTLNGLPSCFQSYKSLVGTTYGEDRIRSGMRHNAKIHSDAKVKRSTGFKGSKRTNHPKGPTRHYTLPNLFRFLEDDATEGDRDRETDRQTQRDTETRKSIKEGTSVEKLTYNSRRTSLCGSQISGSSSSGVAIETDAVMETGVVIETGVAIETDVVIETGVVKETGVAIETAPPNGEKNNPSKRTVNTGSVLSCISSQSKNTADKSEDLLLTNKNEEIDLVRKKTGPIVTVPVATTSTVNSSAETETIETGLGVVSGELVMELVIEGQLEDPPEIQWLCERYDSGDDEPISKMVLDVKSDHQKILDTNEEKQSRKMETII